jgi:PTH1 family peptidyl-tRNA hydrolase
VSLFRRGGGKADWLVVGLGNPGDRYARTRHNVGFEVAKLLAERLGLPKFKSKYGGLYTEGNGVAVLLPQTYMNESGNSASPARGALRLELDHVVAVHDEIDLPFGALRIKRGGSTAGHNGLNSLVSALRSEEFFRVRVGVGRSSGRGDPIGYVLKPFSREQLPDLPLLLDDAADAAESLVRDGLGATQDRFNRSGPRS